MPITIAKTTIAPIRSLLRLAGTLGTIKMNIRLSNKNIVLVSLFGIIFGIILIVLFEEYLISQVLLISGVMAMLMLFVSIGLRKRQSLRFLGLLVVVFSIFNGLRHLQYLPVLFNLDELKEGELYFIRFYTQELIWLILSVIVVLRGFDLLLIGDRFEYEPYLETKRYKVLKGIIVILICLEIPIWGMHYDLGGSLHGHSLWEGGTHFH